MLTDLRRQFNDAFTEKKYQNYVHDLNSYLEYPADFRLAETPVFLTDEITEKLIKAADEITSQLTTPEFKEYSKDAVPPEVFVVNETSHPEFLQIDLALSVKNGCFAPSLVELQGFPSLYGFQLYQDEMFKRNFEIPSDLTSYFNGFTKEKYSQFLKEIILAEEDPSEVILLEIEPEKQKTRIDFSATKDIVGIDAVCISKVYQRGKNLFYQKNGKEIQIKRIYNRVIFDELLRKDITPGFDFKKELNVDWITHPNWFFKISKYSLPYLKSEYAPRAYFLSDLNEIPSDLNNFVLKPLYSFAGLGVDVEPTFDKIMQIKDPENYILQEKIDYAPVIETPDGNSKVEIRMMYLWKEKPVLVNNLVRMSKGKMMGVDFNKNKTWVGSSLAYHKK